MPIIEVKKQPKRVVVGQIKEITAGKTVGVDADNYSSVKIVLTPKGVGETAIFRFLYVPEFLKSNFIPYNDGEMSEEMEALVTDTRSENSLRYIFDRHIMVEFGSTNKYGNRNPEPHLMGLCNGDRKVYRVILKDLGELADKNEATPDNVAAVLNSYLFDENGDAVNELFWYMRQKTEGKGEDKILVEGWEFDAFETYKKRIQEFLDTSEKVLLNKDGKPYLTLTFNT